MSDRVIDALPTCRAGTTTAEQRDHVRERELWLNVGKTTEVGSYPPNPWGLHDIAWQRGGAGR